MLNYFRMPCAAIAIVLGIVSSFSALRAEEPVSPDPRTSTPIVKPSPLIAVAPPTTVVSSAPLQRRGSGSARL